MTHNLYVCTVRFRPEIVYDVIYGRSIKTVGGSLMLNVEVAGSNSFRDIPKNQFVTAAADIDETIALSENAFAFRLKSQLIVGIRPPIYLINFCPANFNANPLNILVHDFTTPLNSKCCSICYRVAVI